MTNEKLANDLLKSSASLRERVGAWLRLNALDLKMTPFSDIQSLVHELYVCQIEMELQNEELRKVKVELAQSRDHYSDLYELAPVGYLTLDQSGRILEANPATATMLGVDRQNLLLANMTSFLAQKSHDEFSQHRKALLSDEIKHVCELEFRHPDGQPRVILMESIAFDVDTDRRFRAVLVDITERDKFKQKLAQQDRFNRATLDALSAHLVVVDSSGLIVATNQAWRDSWEANNAPWQSDSENTNYLDICDRAAAAGESHAIEVAQAIREVIAGKRTTWVHEYPCHSLNGQEWFYCRVTKFPGEGPMHVVVAHENITSMHQAQERLVSTNARFETLNRVSPVGIMFFDSLGNCVDVNSRWSELSGITLHEALGDNWSLSVHPNDRQRVLREWREAVRERAMFHSEFRFQHPDETVLWVVSQGVPIREPYGDVSGFICASIDVTALKQHEHQMHDGSERSSMLLKTVEDAVITFDELGIIQSFNRAAETIFGYATDEVIGQNVQLLMPPPDRNDHDDDLKHYRETGIKRFIGMSREVVGQRKDGSTFRLEFSVSTVDRLNFYMGLLRDSSQRKQLERQILEIASLEQQRIGQDLHDGIGQQLTGMILLAQVLVQSARSLRTPEGLIDSSGAASVATRLCDQAIRLRSGLEEALRDIRAVSRELIPVPINADGLMAALDQLVAKSSVESLVVCKFFCPVPITSPDNVTATYLFYIAQGALSNALRHAKAREVLVCLDQNDEQLTLTIRDDGIGFRPAELSGLGLRIMYNRAQIIGATLAIRSVQPSGTELTCVLPRHINKS